MKKKQNQQFVDMHQVYNGMHNEMHKLAEQVLELDKLKHQLSMPILHDVQALTYTWYSRGVGLDWLVRLLNDKKFLESIFMWLYGYMEDEDAYYARVEYLDKKREYLHSYYYHLNLIYNYILPL